MNFGHPSGPPLGSPPPGYGAQPGGYVPPPGVPPSGPLGSPPPGYGGQPGGYGPPPGGPPSGPPLGSPPPGYGGQPGGYGPPPGGQPGGYGPPPGSQPGGYGPPPGGIPMAYYGTSKGMGDTPGQSPGAPPFSAHTASSTAQDTIGNYEGLHYQVDHRDSNSVIRLSLQPGYSVKGKPGSMVCMAGTVGIQGIMKLSLAKMLSGGDMSETIFTGPGEVVLAPAIWGDIVPISVQPNVVWFVGKDTYLASTTNVIRSSKSQGFMKGLMSGEGFFVTKVQGQGILFVQSLGAIIKRELQPGEEWIVDNGHLVAWSASYSIERIAAGGLLSAAHTGEGAVCRFRGPGTVYIQTRNPQSLGQWVTAHAPTRGLDSVVHLGASAFQ